MDDFVAPYILKGLVSDGRDQVWWNFLFNSANGEMFSMVQCKSLSDMGQKPEFSTVSRLFCLIKKIVIKKWITNKVFSQLGKRIADI